MKKKLCIIVPYRDRKEHLDKFLPAMEKHLDGQKLDWSIVIVEQTFDKPFNRAKLLNVGYAYTKGKCDYYCMHDVDMLPVEGKADYSYCPQPTHLASMASQFGYKLPYEGYFGGVTMFDKESFEKINGYANEYWGWGAEDDDVLRRCATMKVSPARKKCVFESLEHGRNIIEDEYKKNLDKLGKNGEFDGKVFTEGLTNLEWTLLNKDTIHKNTTLIKVNI